MYIVLPLFWFQRIQPTATHGFENPKTEIVGKANSGQMVPFGEMIKCKEIHKRKVTQHVHHRSSHHGFAYSFNPCCINFDVIEKTVVKPCKDWIRFVTNKRATAHGARVFAEE